MTSGLRISSQRLQSNIEALGRIGLSNSGGLRRLSLSPEDMAAREFIVKLMNNANLHVSCDDACNIIGTRPGVESDGPAIGVGSHIDTVPNAGKLDGAYGVLAGIEVMKTLEENRVDNTGPLKVFCFTDEEGARFRMLLGSSVAAGQISKKILYEITDRDGISFRQAVMNTSYSLEKLLPASETLQNLASFVELHIEQGPVLEKLAIPIGVVDHIVGIAHLDLRILGRQSHAGTTPMSMRRDPMIAAAQIILEINRIVKETSRTAVGTVGRIRSLPGAVNVIPGSIELTIDLRDVSIDLIERAVRELKIRVSAICSNLGLTHSLNETMIPPAPMSQTVIEEICSAAEKMNLRWHKMPSGAGHDSQNVSKVTLAGMIFVPSKGGISHSPDELTDWPELEQGANVLLHTLLQLSEQ